MSEYIDRAMELLEKAAALAEKYDDMESLANIATYYIAIHDRVELHQVTPVGFGYQEHAIEES